MCVCVCVFGKERQNRTAVPGYSWQRHSEEQTELSMLSREKRDERIVFTCTGLLLLSSYLLSCLQVRPLGRCLHVVHREEKK